jgi:murein DD-endopeptidase MepM/ murein hydrolase activator NlpD
MTRSTNRSKFSLPIAWAILVAGCGNGGGSGASPMVDCGVYSAPEDSSYVLPYRAGEYYEVSLTTGHYRKDNGGVDLYAIDFALPPGSTVTSSRDGTVVAVRSNFLDSDPRNLHENLVFIEHADGTMGRYIHLGHDATFVNVGDTVMQGQVIAYSGSSGASSPHLHFDVQTCCCNFPPDYNQLPCSQTVPVVFRNTSGPQQCGVSVGVAYTANPFVPDPG